MTTPKVDRDVASSPDGVEALAGLIEGDHNYHQSIVGHGLRIVIQGGTFVSVASWTTKPWRSSSEEMCESEMPEA